MILSEVTETNSYIINLVILLGKRLIFKAADVDSLNMNQFRMFIKRHFILGGSLANINDDIKKYFKERWERFIVVEGWYI